MMYSLRRLRKNVAAPSAEPTDKLQIKNDTSFWSSSIDESHGTTGINLHDEETLERELQRHKKMAHCGTVSSWSQWFRSHSCKLHLTTDDGLTKNDPISPTMLISTQQKGLSRLETMVPQYYSKDINSSNPGATNRKSTPPVCSALPAPPKSSTSQLLQLNESETKSGKTIKKYYVDTNEASTEEDVSGDDETAAETPSPPSTARGYLNRFRHGQWV